ncbi:hypothetical protein ACFLTE_04360 [Bacteroidota bacterium]
MNFQALLDIAKNEDIPVFGMGPSSEMSIEPVGHRPDDFLPDTKGIICFGIPVPEGVYQSNKISLEIGWRSQNLLYRKLDTLSLHFSNLLEKNGYKSIPIFGCMPLDLNKDGIVVGYVNQLKMAELLNIGTIGKNGLLIHSKFGSRLMLEGLITTALLPYIHYPEINEPGCPPDCTIYSDACPVNAIIPEEKNVKIMRCLGYTSKTPLMSRIKFWWLRKRNKEVAAQYMSTNSVDELTFHICSECVAQCPYSN